jgi:hypothetical protein
MEWIVIFLYLKPPEEVHCPHTSTLLKRSIVDSKFLYAFNFFYSWLGPVIVLINV